jgi:hypothetical protein
MRPGVRRAGLPRQSPALTPGQRRRRRRLDLTGRTVHIRAAYVERSTSELLLGPPKSKAGHRVVGIPAAIILDLQAHLVIYAGGRWRRRRGRGPGPAG